MQKAMKNFRNVIIVSTVYWLAAQSVNGGANDCACSSGKCISTSHRPIVAKLCTVISICVNFLMQVQKLGGPPLKNFTPAKFSVDFTQLPTFIANISGTRQDIRNRKDTRPRAIPPAFSQTSPVNFGPVSQGRRRLLKSGPAMLSRRDVVWGCLGILPRKKFDSLFPEAIS